MHLIRANHTSNVKAAVKIKGGREQNHGCSGITLVILLHHLPGSALYFTVHLGEGVVFWAIRYAKSAHNHLCTTPMG